MNQADLEILLREGEGSMLEYKESLSSSLVREVVAFANTAGGRILLGVRDDGTVKGIPDSNELRARIQDIARNCDPPVEVRIEPVGKVIVVHVRESDCQAGPVQRRLLLAAGIDDAEASPRGDPRLLPQRGSRSASTSPSARASATRRTSTGRSTPPGCGSPASPVAPARRMCWSTSRPPSAPAARLVFRNAGVLFFARNVRHFFNQAYITCLLAKGADKVHILDRKDFDGGIVADIEDALRFIERNTRTAYRIERLQRENIPEYPMKALREAITNAVMHRDWFIEGANVFVEIYTDRIEVVSPGGLPKGMTLADLGRKSVRRNALIADLLHRIDFIEKAGTGIKRIRDEVREQGCPEPEFENNGFFTAIFRPNPEVRARAATQSATQSTDQVTAASTPQVPRKYPASHMSSHRCKSPRKYRGSTGKYRGSHRGSHRGSSPLTLRPPRGNETDGDTDSLGAQARESFPRCLSCPLPEGWGRRDDHPRQAAQLETALQSHPSGGRGIEAAKRGGEQRQVTENMRWQ